MNISTNNPYIRKLHEPITLSTGAIVEFNYMNNGAQSADIVGREMTNEEYEEFTKILLNR